MTNSLSSPLTLLHGLLLAKEKARSPNIKAGSPNAKIEGHNGKIESPNAKDKTGNESPKEKAGSPKVEIESPNVKTGSEKGKANSPEKVKTGSESLEKDQAGSPNEKAVSLKGKGQKEGKSPEKGQTRKSLDEKTGNDSTLIVHVAGSDVMEMLGIIKWEYILHRLPKVLQRYKVWLV